MRLSDFASTQTIREKSNSVLQSRFNTTIDFSKLTEAKASSFLKNLTESITRIKNSSFYHSVESNPKFLKMLVIREGLADWLSSRRKLTEDEVSQAEVILAAKSLVDDIQGMVATTGKIQNEQVPAIISSIRDAVGIEQATAYSEAVSQTLVDLMAKLNEARNTLDNATLAIAGQGEHMEITSTEPSSTDETDDEIEIGGDEDKPTEDQPTEEPASTEEPREER